MTERLLRARLRPPAFFGALGLVAAVACSSDPVATNAVTHPTLIEVAPEAFLGQVRCSEDPGAMRRYVATLFDITDDAGGAGGQPATGEAPSGSGGAGDAAPSVAPSDEEPVGFAHPSSAPTDCQAAVGFGFVVGGRRYRAEVDGYESTDLTPRGSGTRSMLGGDGSVLTPRWRMGCRGAVASNQRIVRAWDCGPIGTPAEAPSDGEAKLEIDTNELLGAEGCGTSEGEVERLRVLLTVPGQAEQTAEVACGEVASFDTLPTNRTVLAYVTAFSAGSTTAFAGTNCQGFTAAGVTLQASCSKLSQLGTLQVDFTAALAELGAACDSNLADVRIAVPGEDASRSFPPPDCLVKFSRGFKVGPAAVTLTAQTKDGTSLGPLFCAASVEPGRSVLAECLPK